MTIRAVIYARVSRSKDHDETQEASDSIESQVAALTKLAKRENYELVQTYRDDGVSGWSGKARREFSRMLSDMADHKFDLILVRHADRLERNDGDSSVIRVACAKNGVRWQTADGAITDPSKSQGSFNAKIMSAVSQLESDIKSERLLAYFELAHSRGEVQAPKGTYGYDDENRSRIVPEEAARIKAAYKAVAKGRSVGSIVKEWNDAGVPQRKGGTRWTYAHLNSILLRPRNAGLVAHHGEILENVVGQWEPIVDVELWTRVHDILKAPDRRTSPGFQPVHLSSGIARCGVCDSPMRSNTVNDKRRGTRYSILKCSRTAEGAQDGTRHPSARLSDLEPMVREAVINAHLLGRVEPLSGHDDDGLGELLKARARLREARENVLDLMSDGLIPKAEARSRLRTFKDEDEALEAKIDSARAASLSAGMVVDLRRDLFSGGRADLDKAADLSRVLGERFDSLHIEQRRALVRQTVSIRVLGGRGTKKYEVEPLVSEEP